MFAHHVRRGDFSRWITATMQDRGLAAAVAAIERDVLSRRAATLRQARQRIADQIQQRYLSPHITDEHARRVHRLGD